MDVRARDAGEVLESQVARKFRVSDSLVRHCKTAWHVDGRPHGTVDLPLCEAGVKEAEAKVAAIRALGGRHIVCSTARRAFETAQLCGAAPYLPVGSAPQLRELDHGACEGKKEEELLVCADSAYAQWRRGCTGTCGRCDTAFSLRGEPVLIVGSEHINALLMCALLKEPLGRFGSHIVEDMARPYQSLGKLPEPESTHDFF